LALFRVKTANFFADFFGENILKIITSVPGHAMWFSLSIVISKLDYLFIQLKCSATPQQTTALVTALTTIFCNFQQKYDFLENTGFDYSCALGGNLLTLPILGQNLTICFTNCLPKIFTKSHYRAPQDVEQLKLNNEVSLNDATQTMDTNPIKTAITVCNQLIQRQVRAGLPDGLFSNQKSKFW
jgi:hypothetical protein